MSVFEDADWEELEYGTLGDGPGRPEANFIVTDAASATHRRYRNRRNGETLIARIPTPRRRD